jgi:hypothetical protein
LTDHTIELFILKCAVIESGIRTVAANSIEGSREPELSDDNRIEPFIKQFDHANRKNAARMSRYYELFYMLENDIRRLIAETMESAHGIDWWETHSSQAVLDEVRRNKLREAQAAVTVRSDDYIDYTTFGQLSDIIRGNWADFAGMLSDPSAVARVLSGLNMLRGTIAHCGVLAEDEVSRLKLAIGDWFRILEGPKG